LSLAAVLLLRFWTVNSESAYPENLSLIIFTFTWYPKLNHTLRTKFSSIQGSSSPILKECQHQSIATHNRMICSPKGGLLIAARLRASRARCASLRGARKLSLLLRRIHLLVHGVGLLKASRRSAESVLLFLALLLLSPTFKVRLKTHGARVERGDEFQVRI
jgi:hypothetical protein